MVLQAWKTDFTWHLSSRTQRAEIRWCIDCCTSCGAERDIKSVIVKCRLSPIGDQKSRQQKKRRFMTWTWVGILRKREKTSVIRALRSSVRTLPRTSWPQWREKTRNPAPVNAKKPPSGHLPVGRLFSLLKVRNCAKAKRLAQKKNTSQVLWTLTGVFDIWWSIRSELHICLWCL